MLSIQEFSAKIKAKYPQYAGLDDNTLTEKITTKYPEYQAQVDIQPIKTQKAVSSATNTPSFIDNAVEGIPGLGQVFKTARIGNNIFNAAQSKGPAPSAADTIVDSMSESTVKPLVRGAATASVGPLIAAGKQALTGKGVNEPVNMPWIGNINPSANTGLQNLGVAADFGSGWANMVAPYKSALGAFGRGAAQSAAKEAVYNPKADAGSLATQGLIGGGISAASYGIGKAMENKSLQKTLAEERAKAAGLKPDTIETLKGKAGQSAIDDLDLAKNAYKNPSMVDDPLQKVGQEKLKPAVQELAKQNKSLGESLNQTLKTSKQKINTATDVAKFVDELSKYGGTVKNGEVVFGATSPISSSADKTALNQLYQDLVKLQTRGVSPLEYHQLIQRVSNLTDYANKGLVPMSSQADSVIKGVRYNMSESLKDYVPEARTILDKMTQNYDLLDFFNPKLGDNQSSATTLRNLFSPAQKDALRPNIQRLESLTNSNIIDSTRAAKAAMDIVGDPIGSNLIEGAVKPKQALFDAGRRFLFQPEKAAQSLVRNYSLNPSTPSILSNRGVVPQALMNLFGGRKRLPLK